MKNKFLGAVLGTFGLKVSSALLAFLMNLFLTHLLGIHHYGVYVYALAWLNLLSIPSTLGVESLLIRQVAIYNADQAWPFMLGLTRWANQIATINSCLLGLGFALLAWWLIPNPEQVTAILIALLALPIISRRNLRIATMKGLGEVVRGSIPETVAFPLLLMGLSGLGYWGFNHYFSVQWVMGSVVLASLLSLLLGWQLLRQVWPKMALLPTPKYQRQVWIKTIPAFLTLGLLVILNSKIAILVLGAWQETKMAGIYAITDQISILISFSLLAINGTLAPAISRFYAAGDLNSLQNIVTRCAKATLLTMVPAALGVMILAPWILSIFGPEFTDGTASLRILCIGQIVNASTGSVGLILNMTGHEKRNVISLALGTSINLLLTLLLVPNLGIMGAAIASASSMTAWNLCSAWQILRKLKINPTVFPVGSLFQVGKY